MAEQQKMSLHNVVEVTYRMFKQISNFLIADSHIPGRKSTQTSSYNESVLSSHDISLARKFCFAKNFVSQTSIFLKLHLIRKAWKGRKAKTQITKS